MKTKTIEVKKVLKVDLNKKNLLIIKITDYQYFDWAEDIINHLHKWMSRENMPLFAIAIPDGIEIKLEQIEPDDTITRGDENHDKNQHNNPSLEPGTPNPTLAIPELGHVQG